MILTCGEGGHVYVKGENGMSKDVSSTTRKLLRTQHEVHSTEYYVRTSRIRRTCQIKAYYLTHNPLLLCQLLCAEVIGATPVKNRASLS